MASWVYVFSRFTPEALLFEALTIFVLLGTYTGFWVLKKRKLGPIESAVPSGVVKTYLNELIVDAQQMRAQLFGLLAGAGVTASPGTAAASYVAVAPATGAPDPEALAKLAALEAKMAEQAKAMTAILADKARLEKELAEARKGASASPAGGGGDNAELAKLQEKIQGLEGKLAEYSVIEDDLANLKRLQQENAQLRAALSGKGAAPEAPAHEAAAAAAPVAEPAPAPAAEDPAAAPAFEGLVDQVEQSLQPASPLEAAQPAATEAAPAANVEKSDADLVAEFEKMLSG